MKPPITTAQAMQHPDVVTTINTLGQMADELRTRLAEVEKDAARYQAIRNGLEVDPNNSGIAVSLIDDFGVETLHGDKADAAIDAAMEARK